MKQPTIANTVMFKVLSVGCRFFLNYLYVWHLSKKKEYSILPHIENGEEVIVSLTTFPDRIDTVWITIATILTQSVLPNRIILWLAQEQFPNGEDSLPDGLLRFKQNGLEIMFCEDLKSHKKYYYSMQNNPNTSIITIDDDVFYPSDMVENLVRLHKTHPNSVICHSAQEIPDIFFIPPSSWHSPHFNRVNDQFAKCRILGIGGVLYPPKCLYKDVFNTKLRLQLCPWADDLWLTVMALLNDVNVIRYEFRSNPLDVHGTQQFNLSRGGDMGHSVTLGMTNDDQWEKLTTYYKKELEQKFIKNKRI